MNQEIEREFTVGDKTFKAIKDRQYSFWKLSLNGYVYDDQYTTFEKAKSGALYVRTAKERRSKEA